MSSTQPSSSGGWGALPKSVLHVLFAHIELSDLRACSLVCRRWGQCLRDESSPVWRHHCLRRLPPAALAAPDLLRAASSFKAKLRAFMHAWNPLDSSRNVYIVEDGFTLHRNPVAQSSDGARGKRGFRAGRHAWEVWWDGPTTCLGTVALVGVATKAAHMHSRGYVALIGRDAQSWGWNIVDNLLLHDGLTHGEYPLLNNAPKYQVGERVRVILDCDDNTLSFEKGYEFLGVAFRGLPRVKLYPTVSAVYGNTEISMVYLGPPLDG